MVDQLESINILEESVIVVGIADCVVGLVDDNISDDNVNGINRVVSSIGIVFHLSGIVEDDVSSSVLVGSKISVVGAVVIRLFSVELENVDSVVSTFSDSVVVGRVISVIDVTITCADSVIIGIIVSVVGIVVIRSFIVSVGNVADIVICSV